MERIWIYQSNRMLTTDEQSLASERLDAFTSKWKVHGHPLTASAEIRYGLFILLKVDERQALPSGCSIDASVRFMKELQQELHVDFFDRMQIAYRDKGGGSKDKFERRI